MTQAANAPAFPSLDLELKGERLTPNPAGALYWPDRDVLIVSDLHLEKGSSYGSRGVMLPPYDTRATLSALMRLCDHYQPGCVIALGDSFHDQDAAARLDDDDIEMIRSLTKGRDWIWIVGNHDPAPPVAFGGRVAEEIEMGRLSFRHEPFPLPISGEVAGHFHPCAKIRRKGRSVRRRCFATDSFRLIMPSFGAYTGGLNVRDAAYKPYLGKDLVAWMMGRDAVYPVARKQLLPDG